MSRGFWFALLLVGLAVIGLSRGPAIAAAADGVFLSMPGCDSPCGDCDGNCSTNIVCQNQCGSASSPSMMPTTDAPRSYDRPLPMASWILSLPGATGAPPTPPPRL